MNKKLKKYGAVTAGIMALAIISAFLFNTKVETETPQIVSYISIGMDHSTLPVDQNVHDIQRAEEHFSDMVLAWSVAPDFVENFNHEYSGRRQEKQNLIYTINTDQIQTSEEFIDEIEKRINEYNNATNGSFVIARESHTERVLTRSKGRITAGAALASLLLSFILIALIEIHHAHRN